MAGDANQCEWKGATHERMSVLVPPGQPTLWLDPRSQDSENRAKLLRPWASKDILAHRVGTPVNAARNDLAKGVQAIL